MGATAVIAGAAVVSAGASIYSAMNAPEPQTIPPPPPPAGSIQYDSQGNILTQQIWDPAKNSYVTKFDPMPTPTPPEGTDISKWQSYWESAYKTNGSDPDWVNKAWAAAPGASGAAPADYVASVNEWATRKTERDKDLQVKTDLQAKMLGNLNQTPEDRNAAYDAYAKAFSDQMHRDVDTRFDKYVRATDESLNARGLTGSRAAVDMAAETEKNKAFADSDIAQKATMAREDLANSDKTNWLNLYSSLDNGMRADQALAYDKAAAAQGIANAGNASLMAKYAAETANAQNLYNNQVDQNGAITGALAGLAGGLGSLGMKYLYGQNGSGESGFYNTLKANPSSQQYANLADAYYYGTNTPNYAASYIGR